MAGRLSKLTLIYIDPYMGRQGNYSFHLTTRGTPMLHVREQQLNFGRYLVIFDPMLEIVDSLGIGIYLEIAGFGWGRIWLGIAGFGWGRIWLGSHLVGNRRIWLGSHLVKNSPVK
jgi:hypothetical protein